MKGRAVIWVCGAGLVAVAAIAYLNSLTVPFLFDDGLAITHNPTIRAIWPIGPVLSPPLDGSSVTGRPIVNLSFALNYAISGSAVGSYHLVNLTIHALAGLLLFGIVRRTLLRMRRAGGLGDAVVPWAWLIAALWVAHPLQTESVTFIVQRTESLAGLFLLFTLYCFIRAAESGLSAGWITLALIGCFLGVATKEIMVVAPVLVWLYERTFLGDELAKSSPSRRRWLYVGLAASWGLLLFLVLSAHGLRTEKIGYDPATTPWTYALKQCDAIVRYLGLSLWPNPLVMDYGTDVVRRISSVLPQGLTVLALLATAVAGLWRRRVGGFVGAWFFLILAPSSSFVPLPAQTMAEHRMYLPLAAVIVAAGLGLFHLVGRRSLLIFAALLAVSVSLSANRNSDYATEEKIWRDTLAKRPGNFRAHFGLARIVDASGRPEQAIPAYQAAIALNPDCVDAHSGIARALTTTGRLPEAIAHATTALRLRPGYPDALGNLAIALLRSRRIPEATTALEELVRLRPSDHQAHTWLGNAHLLAGDPNRALLDYSTALRIKPDYAEAHQNLGSVCLQLDRPAEAIDHYLEAIRHKPQFAEAYVNLGIVLLQQGRPAEAIERFEQAVRLNPDYFEAWNGLGTAQLRQGLAPQAIAHFQTALRLRPNSVDTHNNLALAFVQAERSTDAIAEFQSSLRLDPGNRFAQEQLAKLTPTPPPPR